MQIHCLGTAGYHPSAHRHTSCYFMPDRGLMLDAGTGVFRLVNRVVTEQIDIVISHAHLDHIVGLTYLLGIAAVTPLRRARVWGAASKLEAIQRHLFCEDLFPVLAPWIEFRELPSQGASIAGARVTVCDLEHPGGSLGFRFDWPGHSLAYITDTVANPEAPYVKMLDGVGLLIHECNFTDSEEDFAKHTGHSWSSAVGAVAAAAHVGKLVLTHFGPYGDDEYPLHLAQVREQFPRTVLAADELVLEF